MQCLTFKKPVNLIHHINRIKEESHKIISIDGEKEHLTKFNTYSYFKNKKPLRKLGIEGNILSLIKDIYGKITVNTTLNSERMNALLIRNKAKMLVLITSIQYCTGNPRQGNRQEKEIKV